MDKRLQLGYSALELSFLLGRENFYVRKAENPLHTLRYSVNETNYLLLTFDTDISSIMSPVILDDVYHLQISTYSGERRKPVYEMYVQDSNKEYKHFKTFQEEDKHDVLPTPLLLIPEEQVASLIDNLINASWFSTPRTGLEVFQICRQHFGKSFHPRPMINLLNQHSNKKSGTGRLVKDRNKSGRQTFIK